MVGQELVEILLVREPSAEVVLADIKHGCDLREYNTCYNLCKGVDEIFHVAGIKGNPKMTEYRPLDFMLPMLQMDSNMIRAAIENNVPKFLYTSSIAVLYPDVDKYPAWAKKTGETLIEAARVQYPENKFCVVRPTNIYGRYDNFNNPDAMVVTNLITKAIKSSTLEVWGTGGEMRDFINAKDVVLGMIKTMKAMPDKPINLCTGVQHSIRTVVETIRANIGKELSITYTGQTVGSKNRPIEFNGEIINFEPTVQLEDGIKEAIKYAYETLS